MPCDDAKARLLFDGTPNYLADPSAVSAFVDLYGEERLSQSLFVVVLCDPVQRAQSAYYHLWDEAKDTPFKEFVQEHAAALAPGFHNWDNTSGFGEWSDTHVRDLFVAGLYDEQLDAWADAVRMGRSSSSLRTISSPRPPRSRRSSAPSCGQTAWRRAARARRTS